MFKTIALFGSVGSAIFCLYFWLIYAIWGNPFLELPKSIDFFIYLVAVAGSITYLRFLELGSINFLQGFGTGLGVTVSMVVVSVGFVYLFTSNIAPDSLQAHIKERVSLFEKNKASMVEHLNEQIRKANNAPKGITGEQMHAQKVAEFKKLTAWDMAYVEVSKIGLGLFIALVVAMLLRK